MLKAISICLSGPVQAGGENHFVFCSGFHFTLTVTTLNMLSAPCSTLCTLRYSSPLPVLCPSSHLCSVLPVSLCFIRTESRDQPTALPKYIQYFIVYCSKSDVSGRLELKKNKYIHLLKSLRPHGLNTVNPFGLRLIH